MYLGWRDSFGTRWPWQVTFPWFLENRHKYDLRWCSMAYWRHSTSDPTSVLSLQPLLQESPCSSCQPATRHGKHGQHCSGPRTHQSTPRLPSFKLGSGNDETYTGKAGACSEDSCSFTCKLCWERVTPAPPLSSTLSHNHKIFWVGIRSSSPAPGRAQGAPRTPPSAWQHCPKGLWTVSPAATTTSLGSPFQCSTTLCVKSLLPKSNLTLLWHNFGPFPLLTYKGWRAPLAPSLPELRTARAKRRRRAGAHSPQRPAPC